MPSKRESFFKCVLSSVGVQRVAHVRAWDLEEAAQLFRTELRAEGIAKPGTIEVEPLVPKRRRVTLASP